MKLTEENIIQNLREDLMIRCVDNSEFLKIKQQILENQEIVERLKEELKYADEYKTYQPYTEVYLTLRKILKGEKE